MDSPTAGSLIGNSDANLIKHWLLWQAGKQELDAASLYESY